MTKPVPSPYQMDFSKYEDSFDSYDDLPATTAWLQSIGAALGKKFKVTVTQDPGEQWQIDHSKKEMRVGSIEDIYTRRGVLGLLLNGVGRLVLGSKLPTTKTDAAKFAKDNGEDGKYGKHFVALLSTIEEVRTDDGIAHEYAGGERVVDTMHAQAYEAANKALQTMAMDMRVRREMARASLDWSKDMVSHIERINQEPTDKAPGKNIVKDTQALIEQFMEPSMKSAMSTSFQRMLAKIQASGLGTTSGRTHAIIFIALFPQYTDEIMKVMVRGYDRNVQLLNSYFGYVPSKREEEVAIIKMAGRLAGEAEDLKLFASHTGGHAQYVIAKAEQYYHAFSLGIEFITPYVGYDVEAKALEVETANEAAHALASQMVNNGITKDLAESTTLSKELLEILKPFPYLDLNDKNNNDGKSNSGGSMMKRVAGGRGRGDRKKKRDREREKKSQSERSKDRKKMESIDNQKNQEKVDAQREGYSIFDKGHTDPLEAYTYLIGPYLNRINAMAAKFRRLLKVNDPAGLRGAYNRGKALNPRILYRHRLNDFRLFARKEVEKNQSYGFAITADISGSTEQPYGNGNRTIQDEIMAAAFLVAEVAERIGEKVMCSISVFDDGVQEVKRAGFYLNRSTIIEKVQQHGGGTNVEAAGEEIAEDLEEMDDFKIKEKTIIFITDGSFGHHEFMKTLEAAKKFKSSIAYFQICDNVQYGVQMCKQLEQFVHQNAKGVRIRTRNITTQAINTLPEAMAQLMKETIGASVER